MQGTNEPTVKWKLLTQAAIVAVNAGAAVAEEASVDAVAVWLGDGEAYRVGADQAYFSGKFTGAMFVTEADSSALNAAELICPATADVSLSEGAQAAEGRCIINAGADTIYAEWSCEGQHLVGCAGVFTLTGGTGSFEGISGTGDFVVRSALRAVVIDALAGQATESALGVAVWSDLKYTLPDG